LPRGVTGRDSRCSYLEKKKKSAARFAPAARTGGTKGRGEKVKDEEVGGKGLHTKKTHPHREKIQCVKSFGNPREKGVTRIDGSAYSRKIFLHGAEGGGKHFLLQNKNRRRALTNTGKTVSMSAKSQN